MNERQRQEIIKQCLELHEQGYSFVKIAEMTGYCKSSVHKWIKYGNATVIPQKLMQEWDDVCASLRYSAKKKSLVKHRR